METKRESDQAFYYVERIWRLLSTKVWADELHEGPGPGPGTGPGRGRGQSLVESSCPSSGALLCFCSGLVSSSVQGQIALVGDCAYFWPLLTGSLPAHSLPHTWLVQANPGDAGRKARWTPSSSIVLEIERGSRTLQPVKTVASFAILANMSML